MSDILRFKNIGDSGYAESEYYAFSKEDLIEIFKEHAVLDGNVFKKIENHEFISVTDSIDNRFKYHYQPIREQDEYVLFMTKPAKISPKIPYSLMEFLLKKEPLDVNENKDKESWIETWHLKP